MKERKEMLKHLWDNMDDEVNLLHSFSDGTYAYFFKQIKFEKDGEMYKLYDTGTEIYKELPDSAVWYAYNNGLKQLTKSVVMTKSEYKLNNQKYQHAEQALAKLQLVVDQCKEDNIPNLIKIKDDYERQSTTSEAV